MNIRIVLVGTTHPGNIGAVARAMKNMGLTDLALVNPKFFPHEEATARASGADDVLDSAATYLSLNEAISDCNYVVGASARSRSLSWPSMVPRDCAERMILESKKGNVVRIEADEGYDVGINEGNLCAKGRLGHGIIHNDERIESPLMNMGGSFQEVTWEEALQTITDRMQTSVNRSGPDSLAGIASEKLTNEENYLFQKLFQF